MSSSQQQQTIHLIIDTDVGFDDVFAINMLLQQSIAAPHLLQIHLLTTVQGLQEDTVHAKRILQRLLALTNNATSTGYKIPRVASGAQPLKLDDKHPHFFSEAPFHTSDYGIVTRQMADELLLPVVVSADAVDANDNDAVAALLQMVNEKPDQYYTLLALGPLTNIAVALQKDDQFLRKLKMFYVMGGTIDHYCDVSRNGTGTLVFIYLWCLLIIYSPFCA